jgi:hypothetical protein
MARYPFIGLICDIFIKSPSSELQYTEVAESKNIALLAKIQNIPNLINIAFNKLLGCGRPPWESVV